ncbi:sialate O-acetylesterase [uncultured Jannaschia sp.]|uniref:sialate O-acetylesterase n=1 Tax=uncultured Jannaschia sp. TaxID=293347 RepID=UPI0026334856|nr:sialate O-acetylesterase [uncultured Jannaschia sp.]
MQAEAFDLAGGYVYEGRSASAGGANIKVQGSGTAAATFDDASGRYDIDVGWLNENDGTASFALRVDGRTVKSWDGAGSGGDTVTSVTVDLERGDTIELVGRSNAGEYARFDWIDIAKADGSAAPAEPEPEPEPTAPSVPNSVDADLVIFAGQSNSTGHFYRRAGDSTGGALGNDVFERELDEMTGENVRVVSAGTSGSGSNQYADSSKYWWDVDQDRPGPSLLKAMSSIRSAESSGRDVDAFVWAQGEDDARAVRSDGSNKSLVTSRLDESTQAVFDYVRDELDDPDLPIFIQEIGIWPDAPTIGLNAVRDTHERIISSMDDVYFGARTTDVDEHYDSGHFSNEGYGIIAERLADSVADVLV